MARFLIVDDDDLFRDRLSRAFQNRGLITFTASNYDEAVEIMLREKPENAVFDLKMPGKSGLELINAAKQIVPDIKIIVLTGYGSIATAIEAIKLGAQNYLPKPADLDDILTAFEKEEQTSAAFSEGEFEAPSLARTEWEHIQRVLTDCNGNISMAANRLGIHRRTLQRKLQKYPPNK